MRVRVRGEGLRVRAKVRVMVRVRVAVWVSMVSNRYWSTRGNSPCCQGWGEGEG